MSQKPLFQSTKTGWFLQVVMYSLFRLIYEFDSLNTDGRKEFFWLFDYIKHKYSKSAAENNYNVTNHKDEYIGSIKNFCNCKKF